MHISLVSQADDHVVLDLVLAARESLEEEWRPCGTHESVTALDAQPQHCPGQGPRARAAFLSNRPSVLTVGRDGQLIWILCGLDWALY
jgi:hypothetical protein